MADNRPALTDVDFPLTVRGKRVYANLRVKSILEASDEAMAQEIAKTTNPKMKNCFLIVIVFIVVIKKRI